MLPLGRFGATVLDGHRIVRFAEKPAGDGGYLNGGFFVLHKRTLERIAGDQTLWEREPMEGLDMVNSPHSFIGFWQAMDTLRDKTISKLVAHRVSTLDDCE